MSMNVVFEIKFRVKRELFAPSCIGVANWLNKSI